jgi:hypothetical protein
MRTNFTHVGAMGHVLIQGIKDIDTDMDFRRQASRDGELAAFRYAVLLGGVLLFSLSLSPFE